MRAFLMNGVSRGFATRTAIPRSGLPLVRIAAVTALLGGVTYSRTLGLSRVDETALPKTYDIERINRFWNQHPTLVLTRVVEILCKVFPFAIKAYTTMRMASKENRKAVEEALGEELREVLTNLGPAFIKFGQMLSSRPDVLPQTILTELQKLCDEVPSFPTTTAVEIICKELGKKKLHDFIDLDVNTKATAAASLGQVYKLKLRKQNQQKTNEITDEAQAEYLEVAVKVQRPEMLSAVSLDLYLLRKYAQAVEALKNCLMYSGVLSRRQQYDVDLVDAFANGSYLELDYLNEASNQLKFKEELVPRLKGKIRVPKVYTEYTSEKVLTTEWIHGQRLVDSSAEVIAPYVNRMNFWKVIDSLVHVGVECFLEQLLSWGIFHADPHPGNLLVDADNKLVLIDFGLCVNVPLPDTASMTNAVVHLMEGDVNELLNDAISLNFLPEDVDRTSLLRELQRIFDESKIQIRHPENKRSNGYSAIQRRRKYFKQVSKELNSVFFRYPFYVPEYFALITRALIVLEGIAVKGNPSFDIFAASYPFALQKSRGLLRNWDKYRVGRAFVSLNLGLGNMDMKCMYANVR